MPEVMSNGVRIHYEVAGEGPPMVLIHGWTASAAANWEAPGWVDFLSSRRRLILPDMRGHGRSEKPHGRENYSLPLMAADVLAVMDHAGVEKADVMGYSMGGMITMHLLINHPGRFGAAVIGGMGAEFPRSRRAGCRDEEEGPAPPLPPEAKFSFIRFFRYLRQVNWRASRAVRHALFTKGKAPVDTYRLGQIRSPVLVVVGTRDPLCPGTRILAERIPNCRRVVLSGRNHVNAIYDRRYKDAVATFLAESSPERSPTTVS
jgi:pimeloyl-ACP methyl ester carboxylesterase